MNQPYELVRVPNGSVSIRSVADRETFHPVAGPVAEAEALYVRQLRLPERIAAAREEFVIWDVGLGAAANPVTAIRACAECSGKLRIVSFDRTMQALAFALQHTAQLGYLRDFETPLSCLIAQPDKPVEFSCGRLKVVWELRCGDFPHAMNEAANALGSTRKRLVPGPHAIFFDAFSPARNPEMWTLPVLKNVFALIDPARPCSLATFSRSTLARVSLLLAGFWVDAGQTVAGKEETTVAASTPSLLRGWLGRSWLERAKRSHSAEPLHTATYVQRPLSAESLHALEHHVQFGPEYTTS